VITLHMSDEDARIVAEALRREAERQDHVLGGFASQLAARRCLTMVAQVERQLEA
jgi:hypothetical protein